MIRIDAGLLPPISKEPVCAGCGKPKLTHTVWGSSDCTAPYGNATGEYRWDESIRRYAPAQVDGPAQKGNEHG